MASRMADAARRSFLVVTLVGVGSGLFAAVAGNQAWVTADSVDRFSAVALTLQDASAPPVTALALVLLASWGVLLVTRGRVRTVLAWFGLLAAAGLLVLAAVAWAQAPDLLEDDLRVADLDTSRTVWSYVGLGAAVVAVAASLVAVRAVRSWPEMGRRYDSPTGVQEVPGESGAGPHVVADPAERDHLDLWKDLDQGRDPTA